jgi:hypothetical protein
MQPFLKHRRKRYREQIAAATGGSESTSGDYKIHTFTSNGTLTVTAKGNVWYVIVAGGGAGGSGNYAGKNGGSGIVIIRYKYQ